MERAPQQLPHYYKIIWVDQNVFNDENTVYRKVLHDLGLSKLICLLSIEELYLYLEDDLVKDNVLVITSGSLSTAMVQLIKSQLVKKVSSLIVFCGN